MSEQEESFKRISNEVMRCYHDNMHNYLTTQKHGSLTDADVILLIMNLTISISTNIYFSLKQILPTTIIDFDFIRAKMVNSLSDSFDEIKKYSPKNDMLPLTTDQVKEIVKNGFVMVTMPDGTEKRITKEDILIKKEDIEKIAAEKSQEIIGGHTPKIIIPNNRSFQR